MKPPVVLLATRNAAKLRELAALFAAAGLKTVDLAGLEVEEEPAAESEIEVFESFEANAVAKAKYFYEVSGGVACVADDSGLEVEALGGAPGVRSRRWSGAGTDAANNVKLVSSLRGVEDRRARVVCAAAFVGLGHELVQRGVVAGAIIDVPRGSSGFGYDPHFVSAELGKTFAEATLAEKSRVSHRARAFTALLAAIAAEPAR
ncbi:MAG TPA: non-canonical purine NTP pyrophosphatase [Gemmatimonadaceae bacterium]|nr:non-canonical purine NTP pyrophosphatase [Gemmatimonadaceae bacterium]